MKDGCIIIYQMLYVINARTQFPQSLASRVKDVSSVSRSKFCYVVLVDETNGE